MRTLEKYFKDCAEAEIIDFCLRVHIGRDGSVTFYIHPEGKDGDTLDFAVEQNGLRTIQDTKKGGGGSPDQRVLSFTRQQLLDAFAISRRVLTARGQRETFFQQLGVPYVDHEK